MIREGDIVKIVNHMTDTGKIGEVVEIDNDLYYLFSVNGDVLDFYYYSWQVEKGD